MFLGKKLLEPTEPIEKMKKVIVGTDLCRWFNKIGLIEVADGNSSYAKSLTDIPMLNINMNSSEYGRFIFLNNDCDPPFDFNKLYHKYATLIGQKGDDTRLGNQEIIYPGYNDFDDYTQNIYATSNDFTDSLNFFRTICAMNSSYMDISSFHILSQAYITGHSLHSQYLSEYSEWPGSLVQASTYVNEHYFALFDMWNIWEAITDRVDTVAELAMGLDDAILETLCDRYDLLKSNILTYAGNLLWSSYDQTWTYSAWRFPAFGAALGLDGYVYDPEEDGYVKLYVYLTELGLDDAKANINASNNLNEYRNRKIL